MEIKVNFKSGGSFVSLPPQFSSSSENVYVAWHNKILGYNAKTGKKISEFKGIEKKIIGFSVHYHDSFECITACSRSGEVITWKAATQFKILNKTIPKNIVNTFTIIPSESEKVEALISYERKHTIYFALVNLSEGPSRAYNLTLTTAPYYVDVCPGKFFTVVQGHTIYNTPLNKFSNHFKYNIDFKRRFTCVSCHPEDELVLTGDNSGRVLVWQNIFHSKPIQTVFHWHTLPVRCVGFSTAGSYFYSGGEESVLVKWQLDNNFEKKFLPRLASSIVQITVSPGNVLIAVATDDNAVRIIDSKFDKISLIQHLVIGDQLKTGIVLDPRTKALVMNGNVGQIQFYSPNHDSLLYNVDVVGQNKISNERNCKIESTQVTKVCTSKSGLWLATVEERNDLEFSSELRLKFWLFDLQVQNFKLNTSVEYPHENTIHSIQFQPTSHDDDIKCVTVGADKKFKIWQLTDASTIYSKKNAWICLCSGYYRDLSCRSLSFSIDGSLVAVSFNQILTTWLPDSCELKCSLVHPCCREEIKHVQFGIKNQCHLLVSATDERLSVWNLLTLTMLWTVPISVHLLIGDSVTANMAVITRDTRVFVFNPISPEPVYASSKLLHKGGEIYAAAFVPNKNSNDARLKWYQRSPIFFINSDKELLFLGEDEETIDESSISEQLDTSLFNIPKTRVSSVKTVEPTNHLFVKDTAQRNMKKYLEAPVHTMIPIRIMCGSLLKSMILQK